MLCSISPLCKATMRVPNVDLAGCDVFLWREGGTIYYLTVSSGAVARVRENKLAALIERFPRELTLCIMNDATGQAVRISPIAN